MKVFSSMVAPTTIRFVLRQGIWLVTRIAGSKITSKIHESNAKFPKLVSVVSSVGIAVISFVSYDYLDYRYRKKSQAIQQEIDNKDREIADLRARLAEKNQLVETKT
ncbi:MAG: hypothetical protein ACYCOU_03860 [Sulfobacillus sp.]